MAEPELERRKNLSFAQAEGVEPLPSQLRKQDVPSALRAEIFSIIHYPLDKHQSDIYNGRTVWYYILRSVFVSHYHCMIDEYDQFKTINMIKRTISGGNYIQFYELIQFLCRSGAGAESLSIALAKCLDRHRSPYRLVEGTLVPIASEHELESIKSGLSNARSYGLSGAATHLSGAARAAGAGEWADSVRESIHAVESAVRQIANSDSLANALNKLTKSGRVHAAMNEAFKKLYGYTSDESGIRHALLNDGDAKVTEADALFMLGACAAFVTYLVANGRKAGLLED